MPLLPLPRLAHPRRTIACVALLAVLGAELGLPGCSSKSTPADQPAPCDGNPAACPKGQTCWPLDGTPTFGCLPSKAGAETGDSCENTFGQPSCDDGLACDQLSSSSPGSCTLYCDPAHGKGCGAGMECDAVHVGSAGAATISICRPAQPVDGGTDGGDEAAAMMSDAADLPDTTVDQGPTMQ